MSTRHAHEQPVIPSNDPRTYYGNRPAVWFTEPHIAFVVVDECVEDGMQVAATARTHTTINGHLVSRVALGTDRRLHPVQGVSRWVHNQTTGWSLHTERWELPHTTVRSPAAPAPAHIVTELPLPFVPPVGVPLQTIATELAALNQQVTAITVALRDFGLLP